MIYAIQGNVELSCNIYLLIANDIIQSIANTRRQFMLPTNFTMFPTRM